MKKTQHEKIARLITRKGGATALELMHETSSTSVHKRMSEMRSKGWTITRTTNPWKSYGRYFGKAPE